MVCSETLWVMGKTSKADCGDLARKKRRKWMAIRRN
jgi:predicted transglutaminase-like cysteine proteinase